MNNVDSTKEEVELEEFLESENLFQLVRGVPREVSNTCLDLIITRNPSFINDAVIQPKLDRSDHSFIEFKMNKLSCKGRRVRTVYDYGVVNWEQVIARFLDIPVERLLKNYNSLNEEVQAFEEILLEHVKTYVPSKEIVIKLRDKVWFNDELRILYKKKLKFYRKRNNSIYHLQLYHEIAKKFKKACESTKENYFKRINDTVCASSKNWWRLIKYKLGRERNSTIPALVEMPEVEATLRSLYPNRACASEIINRMIKNMTPAIMKPLTKLIYESFETGVFPKCWKNGLITSVYKSGNNLDRSNYRPITLSKALSKIPERLGHRQLYRHLINTKLLSASQSEFIAKDSRTYVLLDVINKINTGVKDDKLVPCTLLDFKKAFDNVNHECLLVKLYKKGVRGQALKWIENYLKDRIVQTILDGCTSKKCSVTKGVPQGSILGPLLFLVYIDDITNDIESNINLFADDVILFNHKKDPLESITILNRDLKKVQE
ncbi:unnamed protein product [Didymodactylos carnosus]|uniref:Reverse transcriptase domain-containing protein n=1 Tax=Didymodactylos carnosus TaxID=1234261 RepID=A0A815RK26_9BILA|nr:unnamed protein product [Didymodactylos carnosus]CAF4238587.1 unnamed protein product [Didymodactylos carnosus]CAF4343710.1 unnamed protein product [Didymodactylos carnosus]